MLSLLCTKLTASLLSRDSLSATKAIAGHLGAFAFRCWLAQFA
jgi:hypothetical protein